VMTVADCYTPNGQQIQGKGLEPQVPGVELKAAQARKKEPALQMFPAQDPWVQQAVELLTSGKSKQVAQTNQAS
jgi:C-terminal processing protease CtpA/Prc